MRRGRAIAAGATAAIALGAALLALGCGARPGGTFGVAVGKVVDAATKQPIAGALVVIYHEATTGDDGTFEIRDIPLPDYDVPLTVSCENYRVFDTMLNFAAGADLNIELQPVDDPNRYGTIDGDVVQYRPGEEPEEVPLAEVEVKVTVTSGGIVVDEQTAHTSARGRFQVSGVPVGRATVSAAVEGFLPDVQEVLVLPERGSTHAVHLKLVSGETRVTVTGRVFDIETQEPIAGAIVGSDESERTVATDENGMFALPDVLVGERTIRATASGYDPGFVTVLVLANPEPIEIGLARATGGPPPAPYNISGRCVAGEGEDNSGIAVTLTNRDTGQVVGTMTTGADGEFRFLAPPGRYRITAQKSGFRPQAVDIELLPGGQVSGIELRLSAS